MAAIMEFIGTFILMSAILFTGSPLYIAAGFLAAITISSGQLNPVVSLSMMLKGDISSTRMTQNILAQVLGALTALAVFKKIKK